MFRAILNDCFQRVVTLNKLEQRRYLRGKISAKLSDSNLKVLDFGCGTGLFSPVFRDVSYLGYDIDPELIKLCQLLYPSRMFTESLTRVIEEGPYGLILANCCFHHIDDDELKEILQQLNTLLQPDGTFLLIDLLTGDEDNHPLRRLYRTLEMGAFRRSAVAYRDIISNSFKVKSEELIRSHVLSIPNPIYTRLVVIEAFSSKIDSCS